jgi:anaphase-promoting complex subunit 3
MILKDLAPDEASVHFLLGKLYKTLGDKNTAVHHFTIALSLDPKVCSQSRLPYCWRLIADLHADT